MPSRRCRIISVLRSWASTSPTPPTRTPKPARNDAFAKWHVLVIRDQHFTPVDYTRAALAFGELQQHDKRAHHVPGHPDVYHVSNGQFKYGKQIIPGETFHTDHSNHPAPPKATMLSTVSLPSRGGDTRYVNMHQAYDDLPDTMKQRIKGLRAMHVHQSKYGPRELVGLDPVSARQMPPPGIHPLVQRHPENGRPAPFLDPARMESIDGMEDDEAQVLIGELMAHATRKQYEYRQQWRHDDWVIWDNRSVMHQASADYDMNERRYLCRLMLKGTVPVPLA